MDENYKKLYTLMNELMCEVGAEGEVEINAQSDYAGRCMDVLFAIDGGALDNEKYGNQIG